jgi:hypothetical protein
MKKYLVVAVLAAGLNSTVFSLSESSLALGFGWDHFFENTSSGEQQAKTYLSAPGMAYNAYVFINKKNIGLFTDMAFLFPNRGTLDINGVKTSVDLGVYNVLFQFDAIIGPGFRFNISENSVVQLGVGLNYMQTVGSYTKYVWNGFSTNKVGFTMFAFNLGIGGDIGIKIDMTDVFFVSVGSVFSFDFANFTNVYSSFGNTSGWADNYSMIGMRPYICIGVNTWSDGSGFLNQKGGYGKPK